MSVINSLINILSFLEENKYTKQANALNPIFVKYAKQIDTLGEYTVVSRKDIKGLENCCLETRHYDQSTFLKDYTQEAVRNKKTGEYIGTLKEVEKLAEKGIIPVTMSLGFNEEEQKWYGWSHRAIHGFGIGDTGYISTPKFEGSTKKKIKTLEEAKKAAEDFAESVS